MDPKTLDRDLSDRTWNTYCKKFGNKYIIDHDEINIAVLRCTFGNIQPYSIIKKQLCFVGDFRSVRHKNAFKKKCTFKHKITQEGDTDIVIMFSEGILDSTAQKLKIHRKKNLSDEQRNVLRERMAKIRKSGLRCKFLLKNKLGDV